MHNQASDGSPVLSVLGDDLKKAQFLRQVFKNLPEDGYKRDYADTVIARFEELAYDRPVVARHVEAIHDLLKLSAGTNQLGMSEINRLHKLLGERPAQLPSQQEPRREPVVDLQGT